MTPPDDVSTRLAEIRERVEAATEGPWRIEGFSSGRDGGEFKARGVTQRAGYHRDEEKDRVVATAPVVPATHRDQAEANARLIAAARSDVPYLLSLVEDLREERDDWRSQAKALDLRLDGIVSEYDRLESAVREVVDGLICPTRFDDDMMECALCVRVAEDPENIPHADECSVRRLSAALRDAAQEGAE